ncbi:MAG TPA: 2-oxoglutarate synthase, partial [Desulfobacteraceae bacterium]|nr:2-oxoglutarate synthase [Desulfobacteraceae bacterium]
MTSFLNKNRPPVFCPGCTHDRITKGLDKTMVDLGFRADNTVIVTDIGCSGLFDTFFNVHALHGVHGRALTYAAGLKLADPSLNVIVTMGDGGLGIGGAHVLAACRKNLDLTLIILNNFNFGMTGGQYS